MDRNYLITKLADAIEQSKGDEGRNQYLLKRLKLNKEITNSDKLYLQRILDIEILDIKYEQVKEKDVSILKDV